MTSSRSQVLTLLLVLSCWFCCWDKLLVSDSNQSNCAETLPAHGILCVFLIFTWCFSATKIFVNGCWVGIHKDPEQLMNTLRKLRRQMDIIVSEVILKEICSVWEQKPTGRWESVKSLLFVFFTRLWWELETQSKVLGSECYRCPWSETSESVRSESTQTLDESAARCWLLRNRNYCWRDDTSISWRRENTTTTGETLHRFLSKWQWD